MKTFFCLIAAMMLSFSSSAKTKLDELDAQGNEIKRRREYSAAGKNWLSDCQKSHSPTHCLELLAQAPTKDSDLEGWIGRCSSSPSMAKRCQQLSKSLQSVVEVLPQTAELPSKKKAIQEDEGIH